jgi:hypothetical protein
MAGCNNDDGKSPPNNEGNGTQETTNPQEENGQASTATPAEVVKDFLEAARTDNKEQVAALLTPIAREEAARTQLDVVGAVASNIVDFELGRTHQTNPKAAGVESCLVRQTDPNAKPQPLEMVWAVRLTEEGWRINGVILPISDQESLFLNYEKPEEIFKQHEAMASQKKGDPNKKEKTILR